MEEIWENIKDYDGYQVSNLGNVRTHNKTTYTKKHGERHWEDRILKYKGKSYKTGYRVDLWKNGKPHTLLVARLVAFTFYNEDINNHKLTVDHKDGNRLNNNLENLELVSIKENIQRAFNTGLMHNNKKIKLINKNNNYDRTYRSMAEASRVMNKNRGYISEKIKKGIYEDNNFIWKLE